MRLIVNTQRRRPTYTEGTMNVLARIFYWVLGLFYKVIIWCMSHLYNWIYGKIYPTECVAPAPFYGKFICPSCSRWWSSIRCWPNVGQQCKNCSTHVHPCERRPLQPWDRFVSYLRSLSPLLLVAISFFALVFFHAIFELYVSIVHINKTSSS